MLGFTRMEVAHRKGTVRLWSCRPAAAVRTDAAQKLTCPIYISRKSGEKASHADGPCAEERMEWLTHVSHRFEHSRISPMAV